MPRGHLTRTRLVAVLGVAAGDLIGATVGQPGTGRAASGNTKPKPTAVPVITGAPEVGVTLVASKGKWSGGPTSFSFRWSRCDTSGAACVAIGTAGARAYTVTSHDV